MIGKERSQMAKIDYRAYISHAPGKPESGSPAHYAAKYDAARKNLLLLLIATVVNLVLLLVGSDTYLLFSAAVPYYIPAFAVFLELGSIALTVTLVMALIPMVFYALAWLLSKNRTGWMVFALVLFVLDCLFLAFVTIILEDPAAMLTDILFHVLILYYLISGVHSGAKLKAVLEETPSAETLITTGPELED